MTVRNIRWPDDHAAILDYLRAVYGPDEYQLLAGAYGGAPTFDPAECFVIDGDAEGEIAAHVMIVPRLLQVGTSLLPTAEISLLGVREAYRGRDYEGQLLSAAHDRMYARGEALGLSFGQPDLFEPWSYAYAVGLYLTSYESDISTELALRAGRWNMEHSYERRTAERLGARSQTVEVRRFYLNDLPAVQALYAAESARGHYLIARDEAAWTWQLSYLADTGRYEPDDFLVAEVDGQLVAYARIVSKTPVNAFRGPQAASFSVIEAGGDHADGVEALLAEIGRSAQASGAERIGLFVHPHSALMQHALARGASLRHFTGAGLVRLDDLALALDAIQPTLDAHWQNSHFAGRGCHLIVTTEDAQAAITVGPGEPSVVELEMHAAQLVRLITGWYSMDHVSAGYHEQHAERLRVLFPPGDPKLGLADLI
jgi:GNAT superfamily N-acetyltransferase